MIYPIAMFETVTAAIVLAICLVFMIRLLVGPLHRARFDSWLRLAGLRLKHNWQRLATRRRRPQKSAEQIAEEAIRRARGDDGHWEGNVYKPKSFSKRPPRDKMH
ncbi:MAG: hypothetical protein ABW190_14735 [Rhizobacter sp.]